MTTPAAQLSASEERSVPLVPVPICCVLFVMSGAAGLIYEATWVRYLKTILGHEAFAQALVLGLFLGGIAAGAAIAGRKLSSIGKPLVLYAAVEAVLAVAAVYFHDLFVLIRPGLTGTAERWTVAVLLILPQSILLGTTFPLLAAALVRGRERIAGKIVSLLYFSNSIGGTIGVLSVGVILVEVAGLPGTMLAGGVLSAVAGLVAWVLHHRFAVVGPLMPSGNKEDGKEGGSGMVRKLLLVAFGTGLASLIYEVVWVRMLALVVGSSTRAFELMLAVFILGLALGGLYARRFADRKDRTELLAKTQLMMGVLVIAGTLLYPYLFDLLSFLRTELPRNDEGYQMYGVATIGISLALMFAPTFCAGMTLPLLTRAVLVTTGERSLGSVYAWNTAGSIVGILLAIHVLMPQLGLRLSLAAGAAVDIALALMLFAAIRTHLSKALVTTLASVIVVGAQAAYSPSLLSSGVFRHKVTIAPEDVLYFRHGKTSTVSVVQQHKADGEYRSIINNGKNDSSVIVAGELTTKSQLGDDLTVLLLATLPLLYHPEAEHAAVIGFGTGVSAATLLKSRNLQEVVTAEIEEAVLEAGQLFAPNIATFNDPRSKLLQVDAKSYFASQPPDQFDIIVSAPTNPWVSGKSSLFTVEHFQEMDKALAADGVLLQWLHLYESSPQILATVLGAVDQVFPDYLIYNMQGSDIAIITSPDPQRLATIRSDALQQLPELAEHLTQYWINSPNDVAAMALADRQMMQPYLSTYAVAPNSDYFPILDSMAGRSFYLRSHYVLLNTFETFGELQTSGVVPVRRFRNEFEPVSLSPFHSLQNRAAVAVAALDGRVALSESLRVPFNENNSQLNALFASPCEFADEEEAVITASGLAQVMEKIFAPLYPAERKFLWERMQAQIPCMAALHEQEKLTTLMRYYEALALGDYDQITVLVNELLPRDNKLSTIGEARVLVNLLLAHLARGEYGEVLAQSFRANSEFGPFLEHAIRLLGAHAVVVDQGV